MRWQYKRLDLDISDVEKDSFETELDVLGSEGWELVATVQHERHGYSHEVHLLFKRGLPDDEAAVERRHGSVVR